LKALTKSNVLKGFVLCIFFIALTENITLINIVVGIVLSFGVIAFYKAPSNMQRYVNLKTILKWPHFALVLFFEIIKANLQVACIVLSPKMKIAPHIVMYETAITDPWLLTLLANAITLTPGTMTVTQTGRHMRIHCLNNAYAEGLNDMKLEALLIDIEKVIA